MIRLPGKFVFREDCIIRFFIVFLFFYLTDIICADRCFLFRELDPGLFTCFNALQKPCHVVSQRTHDLHAFFVFYHFFRAVSMNLVPVLRGNDGHTVDGKIFVDLIKSRSSPATAATDNTGSRFARHILASCIESTIHKGSQCSGSSGIMNRCSKDKSVRFFCFFNKFIDYIATETSCFAIIPGLAASGLRR